MWAGKRVQIGGRWLYYVRTDADGVHFETERRRAPSIYPGMTYPVRDKLLMNTVPTKEQE
jgi:hypothetical protein